MAGTIIKDPSGAGLYPTFTIRRGEDGSGHTILLYKDAEGKVRRKQTENPLVFLSKLLDNPPAFKFYQHFLGDTHHIPDGYKITEARFMTGSYIEITLGKWRKDLTRSAGAKYFGISSKPGQIWDWAIIEQEISEDKYQWVIIQRDVDDLEKSIVIKVKKNASKRKN